MRRVSLNSKTRTARAHAEGQARDAAKQAGMEVERTNACLTRQRRLARDYERHEHSSEIFIHIAMTGLMPRRLA
ncbi:transposase [Corallococcus exiguus]|uniref:transposase n=1 Tax=Corallococcus exiguus TaxID=83462 RepID=UPI001C25373C|nr:transposase [Corallococcus exiguus]NRD43934.1 transposase [Corallococcus exiguus]